MVFFSNTTKESINFKKKGRLLVGKLNILGNKRVEEFIKILKERQSQEIKSLNLPSEKDIIEMVDKEFGIAELRKELVTLEQEFIKRIGFKGNKYGSRLGRLSEYKPDCWEDSLYAKRVEELTEQLIDKPKKEVEKKYKEKIERLWFCETLEEAKEVVYGD